jgi:23S rRNA (cytosine1962-C5)-methyltransferase
VDVSAAALETLRRNAALNGIENRITTVEADVFEYLRSCDRQKEKFDLIILDPPAFAKSRSALEGALRGYKEINLSAMKLLNPGGVLVSCSCSHALDEGRFRRMIAEAAADAERRLIQLDFRSQGPDHPVLVGYDESLYLKCGFYRTVD